MFPFKTGSPKPLIRTARDIPGMVFLPFSPGKIDGISVYETPPYVEDRMQRGDFLGKRLGRITYVCEKEGHFEIPGVTFFGLILGQKN